MRESVQKGETPNPETLAERLEKIEGLLFDVMDELRSNGVLSWCFIRNWHERLYPEEYPGGQIEEGGSWYR